MDGYWEIEPENPVCNMHHNGDGLVGSEKIKKTKKQQPRERERESNVHHYVLILHVLYINISGLAALTIA